MACTLEGLALGVQRACLLGHLAYHGLGYAVGRESAERYVVAVVDECCSLGSGDSCVSHVSVCSSLCRCDVGVGALRLALYATDADYVMQK